MICAEMIFCVGVSSRFRRKERVVRTDWSDSSAMLSPPTVTASTSGLSLRPPQTGQVTSAMYCSRSLRLQSEFVSSYLRSRFGMMPSKGASNVPLPNSF